jgi:hypothetical protein
MATVTPERAGVIEPETVAESPIVGLEEETEQEMLLEILDTVKDTDELVAPVHVESPSQLAFTLQDPKTGGVYVSLYLPSDAEVTILARTVAFGIA